MKIRKYFHAQRICHFAEKRGFPFGTSILLDGQHGCFSQIRSETAIRAGIRSNTCLAQGNRANNRICLILLKVSISMFQILSSNFSLLQFSSDCPAALPIIKSPKLIIAICRIEGQYRHAQAQHVQKSVFTAIFKRLRKRSFAGMRFFRLIHAAHGGAPD